MHNMLPDIVQDNLTDAAKRLGVSSLILVLIKAARMAGEDASSDKAHANYRVWQRSGLKALSDPIRDAILRINEGDFGSDRSIPHMCPECGQLYACPHSH